MTVAEAVRVARIIVHHSRTADRVIAVLLLEFPKVSWTDFFNKTDSFIERDLHDKIFARLEELRAVEMAYRRKWNLEKQREG